MQDQDQLKQLQSVAVELKARIFDMSEEMQRRDTFHAELFAHLAKQLGLEGEDATRFESFVAAIDALKENQVEIVEG